MPKVLILGGRAPTALDHARRFQHQGWTVHVADSIPCRLSGWSRAVTSTVSLASPRHSPAQFVADLSASVRELAIDLVLPTCEEVFYLSRYRSQLPTQVRVLADEFEKLRLLHSKWHFLEQARGCGARVPESIRVSSMDEARAWAAGAPLVLKPEFSRFGVHVRLYPDGLPARVPALATAGPWLAQRFHAGTELCSYSIADRGRLLAHALYRPSYRLGGSSSYYFEPCRSEAVWNFVSSFVCKLAFTGQISFDWIQDEDDSVTVLECNPRATSGLHLFATTDAIPAALTGEADACVAPTGSRPSMIGSVMLSAGLGSAIRQSTLRQWWRDYRRADDVIKGPGDHRPQAGAMLDLFSYVRLALAQRCNLRQAATRDIEWDGEELPAQ